MGIATEMRDLTQEIQASHEARTAWEADLRRKTAELLKGFQRELREMASALKAGLARSESERRREFQAMMRGIQARQRERKQEVADFLTGFRRELQEAAFHWRTLASTMARKRAAAR